MSKTIDERVVEMRFDNKHFEKNTAQTMSTLDKLKQKLNLTGASKGLENISTSANKVNMNGMTKAIDTVHSKFSALEIMGITALANITNSAVNAGKRIVSALTIDPVRTGLSEYETQINAIQTILSNTRSEGTNVEIVNKALDELNEYADKTIYNFTEMTRNIGTFTAAGVKLDTSVSAIKGIANLAAVSGSSSQQASVAMYQLSQALAAGKVQLMDWNSVVNAGMGGKLFQDALIRTSELLGTGGKQAVETYGSFRESLTKTGWLTTEVLTETLTQLSGAYTEADLIAQGFTEDQAKEIKALANDAVDAATKVKTFTQLWDVLKEAAQSGWAQTWRLIIGDFEQAKNLFSPLADFLTGIIGKMSDARNAVIGGAFGKSFGKLKETLSEITKPVKNVVEGVKTVTSSLEDLSEMATKVIRGDFGNGEDRFKALTEAGYNYYAIQNKVNETLGCSFRYSDELVNSQKELNKTTEEGAEAATELEGSEAERLEQLTKLSDAELKAIGYTKKQIEALRELKKYSDMTGLSISEFIENIDEIDGRWLMINSFKNVGKALVDTFTAFGDAWNEVFHPGKTEDEILEEKANKLFGIIAAIHKLTTMLPKLYNVTKDADGNEIKELTETGDKLVRTFKGVFAILDMITTLIAGPIKIGIKIIGQFLQVLDIIPHDILGITATIGDVIVGFHDWLEEILDLTAIFEFLAPYIKDAASAVKDWFKNLGESEAIKKFTDFLRNSKEAVIEWFKGLKEADNIATYIFQGLWNGLKSGATGIIDFVINLGRQILDGIKKVLGIHSPSTEFFEIGKNMMLGLFNGISSFVQTVYNLVTSLGSLLIDAVISMASKLVDIIKSLDIGSIFLLIIGGGFTTALVQIARLIGALASPLEGLGDMFEGVSKTLRTFRGVLRSFKIKIYAESIKSIAIAIGILAASVAVLAQIETDKLIAAVMAIGVLMGLLTAMVLLIDKFGENGVLGQLSFAKIAIALLGLGVAMLIMSKALKNIASIDEDKATQAIVGFVVLVGSLLALMAMTSKKGTKFTEVGAAVTGIATALLLMSIVVKTLGKLDEKVLRQGTFAIAVFGGMIIAFMAATKLINGSKNVGNIGGSLLKVAAAILLMALVAKSLGKMDIKVLIQGTIAMAAFGGIIVGLMAATKLISGSKNVDKIGGAIFGIASALLIMSLVARICASMSPSDLAKGALVMTAFGAIIVGLMAATKLISGSKNVDKIGRTILTISISIGIMALAATLLSFINTADLAKGVIAVGFISLMMMGLIAVTQNVPTKIMGTMIAITVAIGILVAAVATLTMLDTGKLATSTVALGIVLGMFALVIAATGKAKKAMGTILILSAVIAVLTGALYLVAQLPAQQALAGAAALSILMLAMSGTMMLISKTSALSGKALLGVLGILALCVPLYLIIDILSRMSGIPNAATNATVLAGFLGVLAIVQLLCAAAGAIYMATGGIAAVGLLGMTALIGTLYLIIGALALMSGVPDAIANLKALQSFMIVMTGILVVLALIGPLALIGVTAMTALTGLMVGIGLLAVAVGALMDKFPALQDFLNKGLPVLVQLAGAIGEMIGAFVSGVMTKISSGLPEIGRNLSLFMANALPFIQGAKLVDNTVLKGVGILAGAILALTAADLITGVISFLSGGTSFAQLGTELSLFMMNAMPFIINSKLIDPNIMTGVKTLAEAILILTGAKVIEGMTSWLTGGNTLASFGSQLGGLGTSLKTFVSNIGEFSTEQVTTVDCACKAIKAFAEAANEIPGSDGIWQKIFGEQSLAAFGGQLPGLATNLNSFVTNLGTFKDDQVKTVKSACDCIKVLAEAANEIPASDGLWQKIIGENSLATFGGQLPGLGTNLNSFVTNLGTFKEDKVVTINTACEAIKALASAANSVPSSDGFWQKLVGENSLATFGGQLPGLGTNLNSFVTNLGTFKEEQVATVKAASAAIIAIAQLGKIDIENTGDGLEKFGKNMVKFAKKVKEFVGCISETSGESITSAIDKTKNLLEMAKNVADTNIESIKTFGDSLKKFAKNGVKGFVDEFSGEAPKSKAKKAVAAMVQAGIEGAENKRENVKKKFSTIAKDAVDELYTRELEDEAEQAGKDLVTGFANGIKNNKSLATDAGSSLGKAALQAAKDALDENSPSKEAYKVGSFFGEGLINGINSFTSKTYNAGYDIADRARVGLSNAIANISSLIDSDMDTQPTIRPVLDLSDVESGVGVLGSMFNSGPSVGVSANLRAISSGMNSRNQNGVNDDVISAIDNLRKDLGNMRGNTYNVNGITYDDGSNITEAVKSLIRAARVERRT